MDAAAITSIARAVHHELGRAPTRPGFAVRPPSGPAPSAEASGYARPGAAGPHGTPLTPAVGAGPLGAGPVVSAGHGLAVSGFNDQLSGLYRIVRLYWPLLYFLAFPAYSGQTGHRPGRPAGGGGRVAERGRASTVERLT